MALSESAVTALQVVATLLPVAADDAAAAAAAWS